MSISIPKALFLLSICTSGGVPPLQNNGHFLVEAHAEKELPQTAKDLLELVAEILIQPTVKKWI